MNLQQYIINKAVQTNNLTKEEIIEVLKDSTIDEFLFFSANEVRKNFVGDNIQLRALIEFSNICKQNCKYCGIRVENKIVDRYKLDIEKIYSFAKNASLCGYKTIVLQSGESDTYSDEQLVEMIKQLKKLNVAITLSIGEKTFEQYKLYKNAGADRFLLRIETTDDNLYKQLHPNMSLENRKQCLKYLKELKYEVGSGCLVGLPNQTIESLADDILFFKEINADMIGIGPFIPCPNTPLENSSMEGNFELSLKVMALARLLLPKINVPATTAMETLKQNGRIKALNSGANVVMLNVVKQESIKNYRLYPKQISLNCSVEKDREIFIESMKAIGRTISNDFGISKNFR